MAKKPRQLLVLIWVLGCTSQQKYLVGLDLKNVCTETLQVKVYGDTNPSKATPLTRVIKTNEQFEVNAYVSFDDNLSKTLPDGYLIILSNGVREMRLDRDVVLARSKPDHGKTEGDARFWLLETHEFCP